MSPCDFSHTVMCLQLDW